ncbi:hypothetical protein HDZ31DRAFT_65069 [Schizophyllum fasciatum]
MLSRLALRQALSRSLVGSSRTRNSRGIVTLSPSVLYLSSAVADQPGRTGTAKSLTDQPFEVKFARPKSIGGKGNGQTPEQLLAMALSTSFLDAMNIAASKQGKNGITANARVHAAAFLGHPEKGREGFGLSTSIVVENVEDDELILAARELCPFTRALTEGIEVKIMKRAAPGESEREAED